MFSGYPFRVLAIGALVLPLACALMIRSPAHAQANGLSLFVEDSRPLSWREPDGTWRGVAVERVIEMLRRTGQPYSMTILPWRRAYAAALADPNACVYGTALTEERRPLFKWVSPVAYGGVSLFQRIEDQRKITSIQDIIDLGMLVGVKSSDITEEVVGAIVGVKSESVAEDILNVRKLQAGRIDLWAGGRATGSFRAAEQGARLKRVLDLRVVDVAIACNLSMPDVEIKKMNEALNSLWSDGSAQRIEERYLDHGPLRGRQ